MTTQTKNVSKCCKNVHVKLPLEWVSSVEHKHATIVQFGDIVKSNGLVQTTYPKLDAETQNIISSVNNYTNVMYTNVKLLFMLNVTLMWVASGVFWVLKHPQIKGKNNHIESDKHLHGNILYIHKQLHSLPFLPRCMECRRGLAMRILSVRLSVCLSVRPSVCLSNACIVTKRKKAMFRFLYHMKEHLS